MDSSLNNLPESNARKSSTNGLTDLIGNEQTKEGLIPIPTDSSDMTSERNGPIDKHGDSWAGGISGHNNQCI
jgi:hypothetical protein